MEVHSASKDSSSHPPPPKAARACDICRARKQKCDEQRPKCSQCQRMKLDCKYGEPPPTKKDKTLVHILDRLKSLEGKVDLIAPIQSRFGRPQPSLYSQPSSSSIERSQAYHHTSAGHKLLAWPAIQQLLLQASSSNIADLKSLEQEGPGFLVRIQEGTPKLPLDETLPHRPFVGMQSQVTRTTGGQRVVFPALTQAMMYRLATAYFDSYNFLYPFMDRQIFLSDTLMTVYAEGFGGDTGSIIALLVFALGELAIEGSREDPIEVFRGRPSGVRGGTALKPPGLALFNEARNRIGFALTGCDVENVQIYSLAALYYESCSHHVDFWRLMVSACLACHILVTTKPVEWNTPRGDIIKRVYWHCAIMDSSLHLELDLPSSGITTLEDRVGIPTFNGPFCEEDYRGNQSSHFKAYYTAQLALQRLCANLHRDINDSCIMYNNDTPSSSQDGYSGPEASSLKRIASQLTQWRGMLPQELQWAENDLESLLNPQPGGLNQPLDPRLLPRPGYSSLPIFTPDLDIEPFQYSYVYDTQVALLRTRYYHAEYMVYRPLVYKALHFPEQMTQEDAEAVAECLCSCLKWPLILSPPSRHKRIIPYLFCWSQNLLGILVLIHMTRHNPLLRDIRAQLCGLRFEAEIDQTIEMMLDWIRDLRSTDSIANWCWKILECIYHVEA